MSDLEQLQRRQLQDAAHITALNSALHDARKQNIQLRAQLEAVKSAAERGMTKLNALIDTLFQRVDAMANEWEAQIINRFPDNEEEKKKLLDLVAPFRPEKKLGDAVAGQTKTS